MATGSVAILGRRHAEAVEKLERGPEVFVDTRAYLALGSHALGDSEAARGHVQRFVEQLRVKLTVGRALRKGEALDWFLKVNPLRRAAGESYVIEGLVGAGLEELEGGEVAPSPRDCG